MFDNNTRAKAKQSQASQRAHIKAKLHSCKKYAAVAPKKPTNQEVLLSRAHIFPKKTNQLMANYSLEWLYFWTKTAPKQHYLLARKVSI
jgi:hypothetical protein